MSDRLKRILFILGFLAIAAVIAFVIWYFFFKPVIAPAPPLPPPPITPPPTTGLPPSAVAPPRVPVAPPAALPPGASPTAQGGLTQTTTLTQTATLSPFLSPDGQALQYYNRSDGKFYRVRPDGTVEPMTDKVFFNVSSVTWAPDRNQAILEYPDGSNILYNFATGRQATIPRHWQSFSFSPRSDGIAFLSLGIEKDARWLAIANPDGSGSRAIEPLGNNAAKVQVAWSPNDQVVAFSRTGQPQGLNEQEVLLIGKNGENFRSLIVNGLNFQSRWSPDGERVLYSVSSSASDWRPLLWISGGRPETAGEGKRSIGLNTWADKCTFGSATTLYCAVPTALEAGVGLYPAAVGNTPDNLYRVDLTTGAAQLIAIPSEQHTVGQIIVSDDERFLYFTDRISGQLYKIDLK